jgi:hypothetical protein
MKEIKRTCRPGDIAVILGDTCNDGLIVQVLRPDDGSPFPNDWGGLTWWTCCSAPLFWTILEDGVDYVAHEGPLPDAILFPIRGDKRPTSRSENTRQKGCLDLPSGHRITREEILAAHASFPPARTGPYRITPSDNSARNEGEEAQ